MRVKHLLWGVAAAGLVFAYIRITGHAAVFTLIGLLIVAGGFVLYGLAPEIARRLRDGIDRRHLARASRICGVMLVCATLGGVLLAILVALILAIRGIWF